MTTNRKSKHTVARARMSAIVTFLGGALVAASCGTASTTPSATQSTANSTSTTARSTSTTVKASAPLEQKLTVGHGPDKIVVWDAHGPLFTKAIDPILRALVAQNPRLTIEIRPVPVTTYQEAVLTAAAGGTSALPCVMYANSENSASIVASSIMAPVNQNVISRHQLSQYLPAFLSPFTYRNTLYFVPFLGGAQNFYIWSGGGTTPQTYTQWIKWAEKRTIIKNGKMIRAGIGWTYSNPAGPQFLTSEFLSLVMAAGGEFLNGNNGVNATKAMFDSTAGYQALKFMHDTIWKYHVAFPPRLAPAATINPLQPLLDHQEASDFLASFVPNALASLPKSGRYSALRNSWNVIYPVPRPNSGGKTIETVATDGWGVTKSCSYPTEAWSVVKAFTSKSSMITFMNVFQHPVTRTDAEVSSASRALIKRVMPSATSLLSLWTNPVVRDGAVPEMDTRYNSSIYTAVNAILTAALNNPKAHLRATLGKLATDIDRILKHG